VLPIHFAAGAGTRSFAVVGDDVRATASTGGAR